MIIKNASMHVTKNNYVVCISPNEQKLIKEVESVLPNLQLYESLSLLIYSSPASPDPMTNVLLQSRAIIDQSGSVLGYYAVGIYCYTMPYLPNVPTIAEFKVVLGNHRSYISYIEIYYD